MTIQEIIDTVEVTGKIIVPVKYLDIHFTELLELYMKSLDKCRKMDHHITLCYNGIEEEKKLMLEDAKEREQTILELTKDNNRNERILKLNEEYINILEKAKSKQEEKHREQNGHLFMKYEPEIQELKDKNASLIRDKGYITNDFNKKILEIEAKMHKIDKSLRSKDNYTYCVDYMKAGKIIRERHHFIRRDKGKEVFQLNKIERLQKEIESLKSLMISQDSFVYSYLPEFDREGETGDMQISKEYQSLGLKFKHVKFVRDYSFEEE